MLKRSGDEMPRPDLTQERYRNAIAAIDDVNNLADKDIVYDQWPIDDPYRHTALHVVHAMRTVGNADLNAALDELPAPGKNELISVVSAVIELSAPPRNPYETSVLVVDDTHITNLLAGEQQNTSEEGYTESPLTPELEARLQEARDLRGLGDTIPKLTDSEQRRLIGEAMYRIGDHWANHPSPDLGPTERVMGAIHGALNLLQNGMPDMIPAMHFVPIDPETDNGCVTYLNRGGKMEELDWNYGQPMALTYDPGPQGGNPQSPPGSLTYAFETHYEILRDRYRTAAADLFGGSERDV